MSRHDRTRWGAPAVACAAALVLTACEAHDLPLPGSKVDEDHAYTVTVEFRDVLNLVPRATVMVDDVPVGEVTELELHGWHATATLLIDDEVVLPENTVAEIRQTSLLGDKYVALEAPEPGKAVGELGDGDTIGLAASGRNPELEEVLGALALLLNGGGIGRLKGITAELNDAFDGRTEVARGALRGLERLAAAIDDQKGDLIAAMEGVAGLSQTLARERDEIDGALDSFGPAIRTIADRHGEFMRMLRALDRVGAVSSRVIGATKEQLLADLRHLRPVLHELNRVGPDLADAVGTMLSFPFPYDSDPIVKGDYANTRVIFAIDLENLLLGANPPGGGGPEVPELPDLPGLPELPDPPDPPDLPDLPGLPDLPRGGDRR